MKMSSRLQIKNLEINFSTSEEFLFSNNGGKHEPTCSALFSKKKEFK